MPSTLRQSKSTGALHSCQLSEVIAIPEVTLGGPLDLASVRQPMPDQRPLCAWNCDKVFASVHKELGALEEKFTWQLAHMQNQSDKLIQVMLQPLKARVKTIDSMNCQLFELSGIVKGLQDAINVQVQHMNSVEIRLRRWWTLLKDEAHAKRAEFKHVLTDAKAPRHLQEVVTRQEVIDIIDLLKQELRKLVTARVAEELATAVKAVGSRGANTGAEKLTREAQSLRHELRELVVKFGGGDATKRSNGNNIAAGFATVGACNTGSTSSPIATRLEVDKIIELHRQGIAELMERTVRSEHALQDTRMEFHRLREEVHDWKTQDSKFGTACPNVQMPPKSASRPSNKSVGTTQALNAAAKVEELVEETSAAKQRMDEIIVVIETATMRLNALEKQQQFLCNLFCVDGIDANVTGAKDGAYSLPCSSVRGLHSNVDAGPGLGLITPTVTETTPLPDNDANAKSAAAAAAAAAQMVNDATSAIVDCQCTVGMVSKEVLEIRSEWLCLNTRIAGCEQGLVGLQCKAAEHENCLAELWHKIETAQQTRECTELDVEVPRQHPEVYNMTPSASGDSP